MSRLLQGIPFVLSLVFFLCANYLQANNFDFVELKESTSSKSSIAFSPDGTKILTGCADGVARIWDAETGEVLLQFVGHAGHFKSAVFSSDEKKVLTLASDNARIWDVETGKELHILEDGDAFPPRSVTFSPDSKKVAVVGGLNLAEGNNFVRVWNAETGEVLQRLEKIGSRVGNASFSPDGKKIITSHERGAIRVWDANTGETLFDLTSHQNSVFSAVFSPDGQKILTISQDTTARIWDAETGKELQRLYDHGNGLWYASADSFSPDGRKVVTTNYGEIVRVWDAELGREIQKNPGHTSRVWDVETGKELQQLVGHTRAVEHAAFLPDDRHIVTRGEDHTVRLWDAESGKELHVLRIERAMNSFPPAFSQDGKRLAVLDGITARIWDLEALLRSPVVRPPSVPVAPQPAERIDIYTRLTTGQLSLDPAQWDDADRKEFFGNMPAEYHSKYLESYATLREVISEYWKTRAALYTVTFPSVTTYWDGQATIRQMGDVYAADAEKYARGRMILHLQGLMSKFQHYPAMLDPDKQVEYWDALAQETLFLCDKITDALQQRIEEYKKLLDNPPARNDQSIPRHIFPPAISEEYNSFRRGGTIRHIVFPLTDEQKSRLLHDEPLLLGKTAFDFWNPDYFPQFAETAFLKETRDAEREPWKVTATPELSKLGISQAEVDRWDGSLSLHPVIRAIAERCAGVNATGLQTTIDHGSLGARHGIGVVTTGRTLSNTHPALMALISGRKDVVFSTRRLSQTEKDAAEKAGIELVEVPFAKDAFVLLQNRRNPVRNLTLEQYQDIYSGKFLRERPRQFGKNVINFKSQSWEDVGGFDGDLIPFTRNENSGSEELMQMLVMQGIPIPSLLSWKALDGMSVVYIELAETPGGIAYTVYFYDRYMVFSPYTRIMGVNGVFPNADTIASGEYPLVYECVLVHRKNLGERVERFIEWLLSEEGQRLVRSVGYVPMIEL